MRDPDVGETLARGRAALRCLVKAVEVEGGSILFSCPVLYRVAVVLEGLCGEVESGTGQSLAPSPARAWLQVSTAAVSSEALRSMPAYFIGLARRYRTERTAAHRAVARAAVAAARLAPLALALRAGPDGRSVGPAACGAPVPYSGVH